jgi:hypothetical protein
MDINVDLANAQAFLEGNKKRVRVYGGLVRHRTIGSAGLAVALAHETGHHLGGAPYLKYYRWLSSEERATEWAITAGLPKVFGYASAQTISKIGMLQLNSIGRLD